MSKQLPRNLGHRPCHIDPTKWLKLQNFVLKQHGNKERA